MEPLDLQVIGNNLAIKWNDGTEGFLGLEDLRKACPCASCRGETAVMGNTMKGPETEYTTASFQVRQISMVGGYAVQVAWGDNHATGIYSWELLRELSGGD